MTPATRRALCTFLHHSSQLAAAARDIVRNQPPEEIVSLMERMQLSLMAAQSNPQVDADTLRNVVGLVGMASTLANILEESEETV